MIAFSTTLISVPPNRFEANISFDLLCPNETPEHGCVSDHCTFHVVNIPIQFTSLDCLTADKPRPRFIE